MREKLGKLIQLFRITPARAYLLGTASMLVLPERAFEWLSIRYHEFTVDTTYLLEETPLIEVQPSKFQNSSPKKMDDPPK